MCSKGPQNQSTTAHALAMDSKILTANRMHRRFCQCQVGKVLGKFRPKFLVSLLSKNIYEELIEHIIYLPFNWIYAFSVKIFIYHDKNVNLRSALLDDKLYV